MKKHLLVFIGIFASVQLVKAQEETVLLLNKKGEEVKEKKAVYLLQVKKVNDTLWENNWYEAFGPLFRSYYSSDQTGQIRNGSYYSRIPDGGDTLGYYTHNQRDKVWSIRNTKAEVQKQLTYSQGQLISEMDGAAIRKKEKEETQKLIDSSKKEGVFSKVEVESEFPGGLPGWARYLNKNLHYPDRAVNYEVQGMVIIQFIVDKDGKAENAEVVKSVEYSLDKEALRIIQNSPNWIPAQQNGRVVKSYKKQPIYFKLEISKK